MNMLIFESTLITLFYFFVFLIGAVVGSFLNVLIDRLPNEQKITGRSYCDHCRKKLAWWDLVPVLSFFLLKGRCRYCGKKISWQYPLIEGLTGIIFVSIFNFQFSIFNQSSISQFLNYLITFGIISCLIVIFFSDLKYHIIPDQIQVALFVFGLILLLFQRQSFYFLAFVDRTVAALTVAAPIFFLHWATSGKAMGFGDVKLVFNIGFLLGIKAGFLALYFAFVLGGIVGLILILLGRKKLKSKIAFGPFLVIGITIMLFWSKEIFEVIEKIYGV